jgi:hypothetical protein
MPFCSEFQDSQFGSKLKFVHFSFLWAKTVKSQSCQYTSRYLKNFVGTSFLAYSVQKLKTFSRSKVTEKSGFTANLIYSRKTGISFGQKKVALS